MLSTVAVVDHDSLSLVSAWLIHGYLVQDSVRDWESQRRVAVLIISTVLGRLVASEYMLPRQADTLTNSIDGVGRSRPAMILSGIFLHHLISSLHVKLYI